MIDFKKDWSLWLAGALPIAMILFIVGSIYLPRLWAPDPQYGFIYSNVDIGNKYSIDSIAYSIRVKNGKLEKQLINRDSEDVNIVESKEEYEKIYFPEPQIYFYDVHTGESREVDFEEVKEWNIDSSIQSPDGFKLKETSSGGSLFDGGYEENIVLSGHMISKKLNLRGIDDSYSFHMIGWVMKQ